MKNILNRKYILVFITVIGIYTILWTVTSILTYKGIYNPIMLIGLFITILMYSIRLYRRKEDIILTNWRTILMLLIGIIIMCIPIYTLPNISYKEGIQIINQDIGKNLKYVKLDFYECTILTDREETIFIRPGLYYYSVSDNSYKRYFIINPITKKIIELEERFYPD